MQTTRARRLAALAPLMMMLAAVAVAAPARAQASKKGTGTKAKTSKPAAAPVPRRFVVAPDSNEARYRVREQLAGLDLPNDAVGATRDVSGMLLFDPQGRVVRDSSRIVVRLTGLKSDKERRDGYLQRRTLQTEQFPTAELVPTAVRGATGGLPTSGSATFELLGDLTLKGVTRPTVWTVTARADSGGTVRGTAATAFTFKDFALDQPRVPVVLSVADTIKLEYDFRFVPAAAGPR